MLEKQQLAEHLEHEIAMPEYLALLNARPVPYDEAGLALIQKRAYELALEPNISAAKLATLQRIFNYKNARADIEHKKQIAERNTTVREKSLALREQESARRASSPSPLQAERAAVSGSSDSRPQSDHLGPIATDWKALGQRVCKQFGITPEEEARRAELHKTWKNPHARPGIPEEINPIDD